VDGTQLTWLIGALVLALWVVGAYNRLVGSARYGLR